MTTPAAPADKVAPTIGQIPFRQIRAHQDADTITVYQAYSRAIANPAVTAQKLHASDKFRHTRMTWIKPSWAWMLYRSGYSYKNAGQECILALKMKKEDFIKILEKGVLTTHAISAEDGKETEQASKEEDTKEQKQDEGAVAVSSEAGRKRRKHRDPTKPRSLDVKIQWDPERTVRLEKLKHRSIQIGIPATVSPQWTEEWVVGIEDVTARARELKRVLDEEPEVTDAELCERGLIPNEIPFELPEELQKSLGVNQEHVGIHLPP